eukprot:gene19322-biopygen12402
MRVLELDHVVFRVADMERSVQWYRDLLGLEVVRLEEWRRGEAPFVSVRVTADTDRFLLVHAELAMAGNVRSILYDKTTRTADPLSNVVMRTLKQQELPAPRPRMGTA